MTKDELVNSLQKRDPLLANAVSNMVDYILTMCLQRLAMCKRPPFFSLLNTLMQPQPLRHSLVVEEVEQPLVGDEKRTRMNCHGRIVAL